MKRRGPETERSHARRGGNYSNASFTDPGYNQYEPHIGTHTTFYAKYMKGAGLDIGYKGSDPYAIPVLPNAIGVDTDYPGYNGKDLPFLADSEDYVYASHVLEHINPSEICDTIKEWFRVIKTKGHLVIMVPHKYLYEKKEHPPSRFNEDHKYFFTPGELLRIVELALKPNTYRVRHLVDNDLGFNYSIPPEIHSSGAYEIELVLQKIQPPDWEIK